MSDQAQQCYSGVTLISQCTYYSFLSETKTGGKVRARYPLTKANGALYSMQKHQNESNSGEIELNNCPFYRGDTKLLMAAHTVGFKLLLHYRPLTGNGTIRMAVNFSFWAFDMID